MTSGRAQGDAGGTRDRGVRDNIAWLEQQLLYPMDERERRLLRDLLAGEHDKLTAAMAVRAAHRIGGCQTRLGGNHSHQSRPEDTVKTKILVAEDEEVLQALLEEVLIDAGFEVVVANDGTQAIGKLGSASCGFGVIITDINLSAGPDGWAVGQHARMLVPDIPVVYVSGHSVYDWPMRGVPNSRFLSKPFKLSQIIAVVSTLVMAECREQGARM